MSRLPGRANFKFFTVVEYIAHSGTESRCRDHTGNRNYNAYRVAVMPQRSSALTIGIQGVTCYLGAFSKGKSAVIGGTC